MAEEVAPAVERQIFATEWVREKSILPQARPAVSWTWLVAQIHDYLQRDQPKHVRALTALALGMNEQIAMDGGDWTLGWLTTMAQEPPFQLISARKPDPASLEPHTRLFDESWVAAQIQYIRDSDKVIERRTKLIETRKTVTKASSKGKGKKGKGKGEEKMEEQ